MMKDILLQLEQIHSGLKIVLNIHAIVTLLAD